MNLVNNLMNFYLCFKIKITMLRATNFEFNQILAIAPRPVANRLADVSIETAKWISQKKHK